MQCCISMYKSSALSPDSNMNYPYVSYYEFYSRDDEFRVLCDELTDVGPSSVDEDDSISPEEKEFVKRQFLEMWADICDLEFPMRIYESAETAPNFNLIHVACDGLQEEQLPEIDERQAAWLKSGIGSGRQDADAREQVVIVAYAPPDEGGDGSPEEVVFMCSGVADRPEPNSALRFSKRFCPRPPWAREYHGDKSALYAGVAYAKQIAAVGSAKFLQHHLVASIQDVMDAIEGANNNAGGVYSSVAEEFIPKLGKLRDEVEKGFQDAASRSEVSRMFSAMSSKMDDMMDRVLESIGQVSARQQPGLPAAGTAASASPQVQQSPLPAYGAPEPSGSGEAGNILRGSVLGRADGGYEAAA